MIRWREVLAGFGAWVLSVIAIGAILAVATAPEDYAWYDALAAWAAGAGLLVAVGRLASYRDRP